MTDPSRRHAEVVTPDREFFVHVDAIGGWARALVRHRLLSRTVGTFWMMVLIGVPEIGIALRDWRVVLFGPIAVILLVVATYFLWQLRRLREYSGEAHTVRLGFGQSSLVVESHGLSITMPYTSISQIVHRGDFVFLRYGVHEWWLLPKHVVSDEELARVRLRNR